MWTSGALGNASLLHDQCQVFGPIHKIKAAQEAYIPDLMFYFIILAISVEVHSKKIVLLSKLLS